MCRIIENIFFVLKRSRPDILPTVSFLCLRVKNLINDDLKKLTRLLTCIKQSIHLILILGAKNNGVLTYNIDLLHALYLDMRSHAGSKFILGNSSIIYLLLK